MAFNEKTHPYKIIERRNKSDLDRTISELETRNGWKCVFRDEYKRGISLTIFRAKMLMKFDKTESKLV
jgi:hypothetical protein